MRRVGRYEIDSEVGRGGSGAVFRGRDVVSGQPVAVKILPPLPRSPDADRLRARRDREAAACLGLVHPNLVRYHEVFEQGGETLIVMDFVSGRSLRRTLDEGGPFDEERALRLVEKLARAIHFAHERGLIHRDLKPDNILIDEQDEPVIVDFGLVKDWVEPGSLTETGAIIGTPVYLAPEQARGDVKTLDPRTDVWALGVILYELLSGKPPFEGVSLMQLLQAIQETDPPRPVPARGVGDAGSVALWALAKAPERRPETALALAAACAKAREPPRRALAPTLLVAGLLVAAVGVALFQGSGRAPRGGHDPAAARVESSERLSANALVARGLERLARGGFEGAIADFTSATALDPRLVAAWTGRAEARLAKHDERAIADFSQAIKLEPENAALVTSRAAAKRILRDTEGAIADASKAIEMDPKLARAWLERGLARLERDRTNAVVDDLATAIALDPGLLPAVRARRMADADGVDGLVYRLSRVLEDRGVDRGNARDWKAAIALLTRATEVAPGLTRAWVHRAWARRESGDWDGAIRDADRALEQDANLATAWLQRAAAKASKGDRRGSIGDATRALSLDPSLADAWFVRAAAKLEEHDAAGAVEDLTKALDRDPRNAAWYRTRGLARVEAGDLEGAIADDKQFLALAPGDPGAPDVKKLVADLESRRPAK